MVGVEWGEQKERSGRTTRPGPTNLAWKGGQEGARGEGVEAGGMEFGGWKFCSLLDAFQKHPGIRCDLRVEGLPEGFQRRGPTGELGLGDQGPSSVLRNGQLSGLHLQVEGAGHASKEGSRHSSGEW